MARKKRIEQEKKTVELMVRLYCRGLHHSSQQLCPDCQNLLDYAIKRVDQCRFGRDKPTCANCTIHCYPSQMRDKIRIVMRYSGPRMLVRHPVLALHHLRDGQRK